jgi:hypothetical protein
LFIALAIWTLLSNHTVAEQAKLVVTYEMYRFVTLGEPILLTYQFRNVSTEVISVQVGTGADRGYLRVEVVGPDGQRQVMPPEHYELPVPRLLLSGPRGLPIYLLLTQSVKFDKTGDYQVKITYEGEAIDGPPGQPGKPLNFERSATLAVRVAPHNPEALLRRGKEWLALATGPEPDITKQRRAAEALSLIHDPIVIPLLDELIRSGKGFERYPFQALVRLGGPDARRILSALVSHQDKGIAVRAKSALAEMSRL